MKQKDTKQLKRKDTKQVVNKKKFIFSIYRKSKAFLLDWAYMKAGAWSIVYSAQILFFLTRLISSLSIF